MRQFATQCRKASEVYDGHTIGNDRIIRSIFFLKSQSAWGSCKFNLVGYKYAFRIAVTIDMQTLLIFFFKRACALRYVSFFLLHLPIPVAFLLRVGETFVFSADVVVVVFVATLVLSAPPLPRLGLLVVLPLGGLVDGAVLVTLLRLVLLPWWVVLLLGLMIGTIPLAVTVALGLEWAMLLLFLLLVTADDSNGDDSIIGSSSISDLGSPRSLP